MEMEYAPLCRTRGSCLRRVDRQADTHELVWSRCCCPPKGPGTHRRAGITSTGKSIRRVLGLVSRMLPATFAKFPPGTVLMLTTRVTNDMADATMAVPGSTMSRGPDGSVPYRAISWSQTAWRSPRWSEPGPPQG